MLRWQERKCSWDGDCNLVCPNRHNPNSIGYKNQAKSINIWVKMLVTKLMISQRFHIIHIISLAYLVTRMSFICHFCDFGFIMCAQILQGVDFVSKTVNHTCKPLFKSVCKLVLALMMWPKLVKHTDDVIKHFWTAKSVQKYSISYLIFNKMTENLWCILKLWLAQVLFSLCDLMLQIDLRSQIQILLYKSVLLHVKASSGWSIQGW